MLWTIEEDQLLNEMVSKKEEPNKKVDEVDEKLDLCFEEEHFDV